MTLAMPTLQVIHHPLCSTQAGLSTKEKNEVFRLICSKVTECPKFLKSRSHNPDHADLGVIHHPLYSTHSGLSNKKDGYRQQNVRQRQKLISIIDYDVCMTFY